MARVLGIGGVFFKAKDPGALATWYRDVVGLDMQDWGGAFITPEAMAAHPGAGTVFSPFEADTHLLRALDQGLHGQSSASTISTASWRAAQRTAWRPRGPPRRAQRPLRSHPRPGRDEDRAVAAETDAADRPRPHHGQPAC